MTDVTYPEPWREAEVELQQHLAVLDEAVRAQLAALHERATAEAEAPLRALIAEAADAHRRLIETHGFDRPPEVPPRPAEALWDALTQYRRDATAVHEAFRAGLADLAPGSILGALYAREIETLPALVDGVPDEVLRPEPEGLLSGEAQDPAALRARKLAERSRRTMQARMQAAANAARWLVRRPPVPPEPHAQTVPLRALLDEHAAIRLARLLVREHEQTQRALGQAVAHLEAAFALWVETVLSVEARLDRPRFHAAEEMPWDASEAPAESPDDGVASAPPMPDRTAEVQRVREAAQALDRALREANPTLPSLPTEALDAARDAFAERVRRSGYDRPAPPGDDLPAALAADVTRWAAWYHAVSRRLQVDSLLLTLRERLTTEVRRLIRAVTGTVVLPVQQTTRAATAELERLQAEAAEACDRALEARALANTLRDVLDRTLAYVEGDLLATLQPISLDRTIEEAVGVTRQRLADAVAEVPERLTLYARLAPERAGQLGTSAEVGLRKIVASLLSEEFAARLLKSADALRQPLFRAISDADNIRDVIRYNLEAAIEELESAAEPETPAEVREAITNARELTVDGLGRSVERLQAIAAPLDEPWQAFIRRATETFERGWTTLYQRANAQNLVEAQYLDLKTRSRRLVERGHRSLNEVRGHTNATLRRLFRFGRREARRLVQIGQAAAGLAAQTTSARQRTLDALAEASQLHATLPLVYRRLFSFAPLTDPSLFVNRTAAIARVAGQLERWQAHRDASALVVTVPTGGGRTSFVNVLQATTLTGVDVVRLSLTERLTSEEALARLLGEALDVSGPETRTLDALEAHLLSGAQPRRVCIVEEMEYLILRAAGGLDLIERTLIFMSRTDARVFWLTTMGQSGWDFVERTAPQITGLVEAVALPPLTRDEVEEVLMRRHARSGLPLVFAEPPETSPLLVRRLGKAKTPEERQAILRTEFFDGLYRAAGPHLMPALLYWLRAADFEAAADTLTLHPVRPLDFTFLTQFGIQRAFALKALLQHGSLTLAEHDRIFRTTRAESFLLFESLQNLRLIQRTDASDTLLDVRRNGTSHAPAPVQEEGRYRLHPLAAAPVVDALRARNML